MKQKIAKKIIAMIMAVTCIAGMAFSANAETISFGASFNVGYGNNYNYYSYVNRTSSLTSASFSGLTPGAFPTNKYVRVNLYKTKSSASIGSSDAYHYSLGNKSLTANEVRSYYIGALTNASRSCTIGVTV